MSLIPQEDLDFWTNNSFNVCLIGATGVGKTSIVLDTWKKKDINFRYFNGSTTDPFIEIVGVPRVVHINGEEKLRFIKPENLDYDNVEAIFVDEANRCHKQIRNALMELIQFKSVNGVRFPKLRMVWICVNPPVDGEIQYDSEEMDPAFIDRFHVHYEVPFEVDVEYFRDKYTKGVADPACEWWREIPLEIRRKSLSPRRLDYILNTFILGGDISYCAPKDCNVSELLRRLDQGSVLDQITTLMKDNDDNKTEKFVSNHYNRDLVLNYMKRDDEIEEYFIRFLSAEHLVSYWTDKLNPVDVPLDEGTTIAMGPSVANIDSEQGPKIQVLKVATSVAKNLNNDKFRERISTIFYKGKLNNTIQRIRNDTHKAVCAMGIRLYCSPSDLMPPINYGGKLDPSQYIDKCMIVNSIYSFIKEKRNLEMVGTKVNQVLSSLNMSQESKKSCLYQKYNYIKSFYGL